jgi:uncharacterized protein (TIRG00374 family)
VLSVRPTNGAFGEGSERAYGETPTVFAAPGKKRMGRRKSWPQSEGGPSWFGLPRGGNVLKKVLIIALKFGVPIAIIIWLLASISEEQFRQLQDRPKNWPLLLLALVLVFTAISISFVRWHLLVRALHLQFRLLDAFRLGFLGFLFNFVSAGAVGGDLFKAFFIARQQPGRRPEAVATVVVDRMIGLYALLLLTSGVVLTGGVTSGSAELRTLGQMTIAATALGGVGILMLMVPGFTSGAVSEFLTGLPRVGTTLGKLITAVRIYRNRWPTILVAVVMSLGVHTLLALGMFLIAKSLFEHVPTLREHLIMVPLGMVAGALPFTPAGFGAFEFAIEKLYEIVPAADNIDVAGVLVALVYRLMTIVIAAVGMVIYWTSKSEVRQLLKDAEQLEE